MQTVSGRNTKWDALCACGTLNPHPERVKDPMFCAGEYEPHRFFDAYDLVQVKYEMLRRVRIEHVSVNVSAKAHGFSRMTWYQVQKQYTRVGMVSLLPQTRGPKQGYKLNNTLIAAVHQQRAETPAIQTPHLQEMVSKRFGICVHVRSLNRALHTPVHPKKH